MIRHVQKNAADRRLHPLAGIAGLALMVFIAGAAHAEKADRDKPINLEADKVSVDDAKQISNFEGRVVLTQGTLIIRGDRMEVRQDNQGFKTGITWGNLAYFRQKREGYDEYIEGWAERIEYDSRADKMQMFNRASMKKGSDEVRGNYISYDATTEFFQVSFRPARGRHQSTSPDSSGLVRAVLQPKPKEKPAAQPPVPLKSAAEVTAPREAAPDQAR